MASLVAERAETGPVTFVGPGGTIPEEWGTHVTVIRKNWGTRGIPEKKVDYLDRVEFTGGVARNVPIEVAQAWLKNKLLGLYVLEGTAEADSFIKATGFTPMPPEEFATMIKAFKVEDLAALLGEERTLELANDLRRVLGVKDK